MTAFCEICDWIVEDTPESRFWHNVQAHGIVAWEPGILSDDCTATGQDEVRAGSDE